MSGFRGDLYFSSESTEWSTPQFLFDYYDRIYTFEMDVCASAGNAKCPVYYDRDDDALSQPWLGRCWMNPPYGRSIGDWTRKARLSAEDGALVVGLLPAKTDTRWWHEDVLQGQIEFLRNRVRFGGVNVNAPFPSAVVVWKPPLDIRALATETTTSDRRA